MNQNRPNRPLLIVYYSRSGQTKQVATALAELTGADLLEIRTARPYGPGARGYAIASLDALFQRQPEIHFLKPLPDLSRYTSVVVGTPVWFSSVSPPVRTFLKNHGASIQNLALMLVHGGSGASRTFDQMEEISGKRAVAFLKLKEQEVKTGTDAAPIRKKLAQFAREIGLKPVRKVA
jgi:flavodoxin